MNLAIILLLFLLVMVGVFVLIIITAKSYKNTVHIARQIGKDPSDVMWYTDKCRVVNKDGAWRIEFKKLKESTRSIEGKWWTKIIKPASMNKILKVEPDKWQELNMRSHLARGLFLYETNEGEFYPMTITSDAEGFKFSVLDQDNRQFVISETQGVNDLTRDRKKELTLMMAIVVGIIAIVILTFSSVWWISHMHDKNIAQTAQICGYFAQNVVNGNVNMSSASYLNTLTQVIGG